ncbi:hypothetical protein L7F22_011138 [Adiantum nelumboides]|nr:hypothetical protein [Adiantum nelumboides]
MRVPNVTARHDDVDGHSSGFKHSRDEELGIPSVRTPGPYSLLRFVLYITCCSCFIPSPFGQFLTSGATFTMADNNIDVFKMFAAEDRLDGDNYPMWAYMMQHVLVSKGVWNMVQGIDVRPGTVDVAEVVDVAGPSTRTAAVRSVLPTAEQARWDVKDAQAHALIALSVKRTITPHIRSAKSAKQAWDIMAGLYAVNVFEYGEYELQFTDLWDKWVATLAIGERAPDVLKRDRFVAGLCPPLKDKVKARFPVTFEAAREVARLKERNLRYQLQHREVNQEEDGGARPPPGNVAPPHRGLGVVDQQELLSRITSQLEDLSVHLIRAPAPPEQGRGQRRQPQDYHCYNCGEEGHQMYFCPHPRRNANYRGPRQQVSPPKGRQQQLYQPPIPVQQAPPVQILRPPPQHQPPPPPAPIPPLPPVPENRAVSIISLDAKGKAKVEEEEVSLPKGKGKGKGKEKKQEEVDAMPIKRARQEETADSEADTRRKTKESTESSKKKKTKPRRKLTIKDFSLDLSKGGILKLCCYFVVKQGGYRGFYARNTIDLNPRVVNDIHKRGGTLLGTSRGGHDTNKIVSSIEDRGINQVYIIGGDGTQRGAAVIYEEIRKRGLKVAVVGIPKTIDNDIAVIDRSFGFDTAVEEAQRAINAAHTEAESTQNGIGLVKLMGRYSGYIAMYATLASRDVDLCLIPEVPFYLEGDGGLYQFVKKRLRENGHMVIVAAEGAGQELIETSTRACDASGNQLLHDVGLWLSQKLKSFHWTRSCFLECFHVFADPTYMIRAIPSNAADNVYCTLLAQSGIHGGMAGYTGFTVGPVNGRHAYIPISRVTERQNQVNIAGRMWARLLSSTNQPAFITQANNDFKESRATQLSAHQSSNGSALKVK